MLIKHPKIMKINWKKLEDQSYRGVDEEGNVYRQPANQETTTVFLFDGRSGQGWTPQEAFDRAINSEYPEPDEAELDIDLLISSAR